ncbi:MAG: hypothetical protein M1522_04035 [Actinobacteria bacterium]|nr:hypothetical protein [Actinomycetota bacterium]
MTEEREGKPDELLVALLGKQQAAGSEPAAPQEPRGPTVDAATLTPAELRDLWTWGQTFRARYRVENTIPECWIVHHAMRAEVLGLRLGWDAVAAGAVPLESWHYTVDLALGRIERRWGKSCAAARSEHRPDGAPRTDDAWLREAIQERQEALPAEADVQQPDAG